MNWNDYEALWRRQPLPLGADADVPRLHASFAASHRKLAATLAARDWLEAGAGLFVAIALCGMAVPLMLKGKTVWPLLIGIGLVLGVTALFVRERLRARRHRLGADAPLLAKIEADLTELRRQRWLLRGVAAWYLAPIFAAVLCALATFYLNAQPWESIREPWFIGGFAAFYALLCSGIWWMSRSTVRRHVEPRLVELEKLRDDLCGPNASGADQTNS
jgi:hypothetical protein